MKVPEAPKTGSKVGPITLDFDGVNGDFAIDKANKVAGDIEIP